MSTGSLDQPRLISFVAMARIESTSIMIFTTTSVIAAVGRTSVYDSRRFNAPKAPKRGAARVVTVTWICDRSRKVCQRDDDGELSFYSSDMADAISMSSGEEQQDQNHHLQRRAILEPAILNVVNALGGYEGGVYRLGDEAHGCLKDLKKVRRKDDTDDVPSLASCGHRASSLMTWCLLSSRRQERVTSKTNELSRAPISSPR